MVRRSSASSGIESGRHEATVARRPTIDTVAARAGVGRGTVSRVVNGSPQVSDATRAAVAAAIEELGYVPSRAARNLVTKRTDCVALVISEPEERLFGEPYFAGVVRGVSAALADTQLQLWLSLVRNRREEDRVARFLNRDHVDGVVMVSQHADDPLKARVLEAGLPLVMSGRPTKDPDSYVYVDAANRAGAQEATRYLVESGRQWIASIAGPQDMAAGLDRLAGFRDVLQDAALVAYGDFSEDSGAAAAAELLTREPRLDAIFAASDPMAFGAIRVLKAAGRQIPDDVAVIGFDGSMSARHHNPPLTSVFQPVEEMGREMARLLLAQLAGEPLSRPHVVVGTRLELRGSA